MPRISPSPTELFSAIDFSNDPTYTEITESENLTKLHDNLETMRVSM